MTGSWRCVCLSLRPFRIAGGFRGSGGNARESTGGGRVRVSESNLRLRAVWELGQGYGGCRGVFFNRPFMPDKCVNPMSFNLLYVDTLLKPQDLTFR